MNRTNESVESAIANLMSAQSVISELFATGLGNHSVFDHTGYTWGECGDSVFLTIDEGDWYDEIMVKEEYTFGDYTLLYATEDTFAAKYRNEWNNMSFYIVSTDCGI